MTWSPADLQDLMRSATRFSWAATLLGVQQLANTFDANARGGGAVARAFEQALNEPARTLYRSAETIQQRLAAAAAGGMSGLTGRALMKLSLDIAEQSAEAFKRLTPGRGGQLAWQEFQNKIQAFTLFEHSDAILDLAGLEEMSHAAVAAKRAGLNSYETVWAMEGAGHYYASSMLRNKQWARVLPPSLLIPFHAGFGLSIATTMLGEAAEQPAGHLGRTVRRFLELCDANAAEGYAEACYEALGFAARSLYPELMGGVAAAMSDAGAQLEENFWHGAGRAVYFAPLSMLPGITLAGGLRACEEEAPHESARLNLLSGFCWAFTLINIRHPEILERLVSRLEERHLDPLQDGTGAALLVWQQCSPGDEYPPRIREHRVDPALGDIWRSRVLAPAAMPERPSELFRCRLGVARGRGAAANL